MELNEEYLENVEICPWCNGKKYKILYRNKQNVLVFKCENCGLVYSEKVLNEIGLEKYWFDYESKVHSFDEKKNVQRKAMYEIEHKYIKRYMKKCVNNILDVGCGNGDFLDFFEQEGHICEGVEFGIQAAKLANQKYKVYLGKFPELTINKKYDLIIFRGTIQYFKNPKTYFDKALDLLNDGGIVFITSSPNSESICFNLFKENYNLPVCVTDYYAYSEKLITEYMEKIGAVLLSKENLYIGTPYENREQDILKVADALNKKAKGEKIDFVAPPFFDNMLTLVYKKNE